MVGMKNLNSRGKKASRKEEAEGGFSPEFSTTKTEPSGVRNDNNFSARRTI